MARSKRIESKGKAALSNKRCKSNRHPRLTFKEAGTITTTSGRIGRGNERTRIITSMRSYIDEYGSKSFFIASIVPIHHVYLSYTEVRQVVPDDYLQGYCPIRQAR